MWYQVRVRTGGDHDVASQFSPSTSPSAAVSHVSTIPKPRNSRSCPSKWPWW